jgi:sec-independent protein translocase protein TatC
MRRFFGTVWKIITAPFRGLWWLVTAPYRALRAIRHFMTVEPTSHSYGEIFTSLTQDKQARDEMIETIEKFRYHILRSIVALFIATAIAWIYVKPITAFLAIPVGGPKALQVIDLTESIGVFMKIAFTVGLAVVIPYIAFELWLFAAPGLTARERWTSLIGIPLTAILFWLGVAFTHFYMLPAAITFLRGFGDFQVNPTAERYYALITHLLLWIGLFFEFPLVIFILTSIGLVKPKFLVAQWRLAIIIIGLIAAIITPTTDMGSMALVMAPMIVLYFISIGLSFIAYRRKKGAAPDSA